MPSAKNHRDMLKPGVRFFLTVGRLPEPDEDPDVPQGFGNGIFEAFMLWGRLIRSRAAVVNELRELWHDHEAEIRAAAGDEEPWVAKFLKEQEHTDSREGAERI